MHTGANLGQTQPVSSTLSWLSPNSLIRLTLHTVLTYEHSFICKGTVVVGYICWWKSRDRTRVRHNDICVRTYLLWMKVLYSAECWMQWVIFFHAYVVHKPAMEHSSYRYQLRDWSHRSFDNFNWKHKKQPSWQFFLINHNPQLFLALTSH